MLRFALSTALLTTGQLELADVALADVRKVPAELQGRVRYLTLDEFTPAQRASAKKVLDGHVNGLSRETDLTPLAVVNGSAGAVLRLALDDYGWDRKVYEQLKDQDPYDHVTIETVSEPAVATGFVWRNVNGKPDQRYLRENGRLVGKLELKSGLFFPWIRQQWGRGGKPPVPVDAGLQRRTGKQRVLADRLGKGVAELARLTRSEVPILKAAWFFNQTAAGEGRTPNYYDFLGIANEKAFQDLVGFDAQKKRRKVEIREVVAVSGVSPADVRAIVRETAEDGGYWKTYDFRRALDRVNGLRVLGRDIDTEFANAGANDAATEQQGPLPNGLWAWFLGNNAGVRQDTAPDFAASDHQSKSNDHRVHINVSCLRCHRPGGMNDIDTYIRNLIQPPLALQSPDYKVLRQLRQQYLRRLVPFVERDRAAYAAAVLECTGWPVETYQAAYAAFWERYEDAKVDLAWAARDLGVKPQAFKAALSASLLATGSLDNVLAVFLLDGQRKRTIGIRQWEEAFPLARQLMKGSIP